MFSLITSLFFILAGVFLFVFGLIGLIRGKIILTKGTDFSGSQARWAGLGLMVLGVLLDVIGQAITNAH